MTLPGGLFHSPAPDICRRGCFYLQGNASAKAPITKRLAGSCKYRGFSLAYVMKSFRICGSDTPLERQKYSLLKPPNRCKPSCASVMPTKYISQARFSEADPLSHKGSNFPPVKNPACAGLAAEITAMMMKVNILSLIFIFFKNAPWSCWVCA